MSSVPNLTIAPTRYPSNPVFPLGAGGSWNEKQVFDFVVLPHPWDETKLLALVSGMEAPVATGTIRIGYYTALKSDPYDWTEGGVLMAANGSGWEAGGQGVRIDSGFYDADEDRIEFYFNAGTAGTSSVGVAFLGEGLTLSRYGSNPVLTPDGQGRDDGDHVSQFAVTKQGTTRTGVYSYRNGATVLPALRYATSTSGFSFTKQGAGDIFSLPVEGLYHEFHQVIETSPGVFTLILEAGNADEAHPFSLWVAQGDSPFSFSDPEIWLSGSGGGWDADHAATCWLFYNALTGWHALYAGSAGFPYHNNVWPGGIVDVPSVASSRFATVFAGVVR